MPKASSRRTPKINPDHVFIVGRFGVIFLITAILAGAIALKMVDNTMIHAEDYNNKAFKSLADTAMVEPFRGEILAADGSILATNLYYYDVSMDLRSDGFEIVDFDDNKLALCDSLAKYYEPHSREAWLAKFKKAITDKPKEKRTHYFVLAKGVPRAEVDRIKSFPFFKLYPKKANKTGLKADPVLKRCYPFGKMARLSIGRVGQTSECPEVHGRSGLERALDTLLFGIPGEKVKGVSTRGTKYTVTKPAIDGYDVYTTIDITMQDILENELGNMLLAANAEWGSAILMEVATGDIKAMSNLELDKKSATPRYIEALNRSVEAYEPGSVMKVMTMAVALEKGYAHPNAVYSIGRSYAYLGKRPINDTHSPASLSVSQFIEYSSNIGMCKMMMPHYESNPARFKQDLAEFGFFDRLNTGIARERIPFFPSKPGKIDLSRMVFGYTTQIPPLYTCAFYNAVANDGKFVRPRLVRGLRTPDGRDSIIEVSYVRERMMSSRNAATLRKMMRGVVWEQGGTAKVLKNDLVEIAGKTGTCKIALERPKPIITAAGDTIKQPFKGGYLEGHYRVTFCGFFPYENPKYTCIVVINDPKVPYRGPAVSSGIVLKNVALKLYARSMLNPNPSFKESPDPSTRPTVYSSFNTERNRTLHNELRIARSRVISKPIASGARQIPDVRGVSLREAIATLESKDYSVSFKGVGYVYAQTPAPGTTAGPGTKVKLLLRHD